MAEYIGIKGSTIQTIAGDPANPIAGQVWYNSTATTLKAYGQQGTGAWASGGAMPANLYSGGYCGTQTAGVMSGGLPGESTATYLYDGTTWTTSPASMNTGRHYLVSTGIGTQTSGLFFGGEGTGGNKAATEEFDGTAWAESGDLSTARNAVAGAGTQTAGLAMTGGATTIVQTYDGTSWALTTAAPQSKNYAAGGGTQTSAILAAGSPGVATSDTFDGTAWTETANVNTGRADAGRGCVDNTAAIIFGGSPAPGTPKALTESWDGSAWTEVGDLATARASGASNGTSMAAINAGGTPPNTGLTEEWTIPDATKTFTAT